MSDEIIRELWRIKDSIAEEHGYDAKALVAYLQNKHQMEGRRAVDLGAMKGYAKANAETQSSARVFSEKEHSASYHYHVHFRTLDGGERVIPKRFRSLASAMRTAKQVGEYLTFNGVERTDFTTNLEPCEDSWASCRYRSGAPKDV